MQYTLPDAVADVGEQGGGKSAAGHGSFCPGR